MLLGNRTWRKHAWALVPLVVLTFITLLIGNIAGQGIQSMAVLYSVGLLTLLTSTCLLIQFGQHLSQGCPNAVSVKSLLAEFNEAASHCRVWEDLKKIGAGPWFVTTDYLLKIESETEAREIIIWTPEISMDIQPEFVKLITDNMKRGVSYSYYIPDSAALQGDVAKFKDLLAVSYPSYEGQLHIEYIPEILIVNGITMHLEPVNRGFVNIPHRDFKKKYFTVMDQTFFHRNLHCIKKLAKLSRDKRTSWPNSAKKTEVDG